MCAQILTQALLFLGTLCKSSVGSTLGHILTSLLFMLILNVPELLQTSKFFKNEKFRIFFFFFSKREILKVANHSLQVLTKQMGFDTSGLILNANMSIYALAQVLLSLNLSVGGDRRFFKFQFLNSVVPILAIMPTEILSQKQLYNLYILI